MQSICRTCLNPVTDNSTYPITATLRLNNSEETFSVRKMLKNCIPELALDMIEESVICHSCLSALSTFYKFKLNCLKNEKRIQQFIRISTRNLNFNKIFGNEVDESDEMDYNITKIHTCYICKKNFMSEIFLKKHMKTHENQVKYECGVCGKLFNESVRLKVHILTHSQTEDEVDDKEQINPDIVQEEADFDESVSSKIPPFMLATSQNVEYSGNFEIVNVFDCKDEVYKPETRKIWTDEETLQFISLCKRHVKDMYQTPKKSLWSLVSKKLAAKNIHVSLDQCESKWKNLIRTYNTVKAKLAKDPKAHTKFHYLFEFDEVMSIMSKFKPHSYESRNYESNRSYENLLQSIPELQDYESNAEVIVLEQDESFEHIENQSEMSKIWSHEEVLALLHAYQQCKAAEIGDDTDAEFWNAVAKDLEKYNYTVTSEQCEAKWKCMVRIYRNIKARLQADINGKATTNFPYFNRIAELVEEVDSIANELSTTKDKESLQRLLENDLNEEVIEIASKRIKLDEENYASIS